MKKMLKLMLAMMLVLVLLVGCGQTVEVEPEVEETPVEKPEEKVEEEKEEEKPVEPLTINLVAPMGAPTVSLVKMFKENPSLGEGVEVKYESVKSPALMAPRLISGEADIAIVPSNLAIKLYNKGIGIQLAGTTVWGILYIATTDEKIEGWGDLKGKEINMIGRGLTPDVVVRYLLEANGLVPDVDVTFNYVGGAADLAPMFIAGKSTLSIMPEPMLTKVLTKRDDARIVLDLQKEWAKATEGDTSYPQAVIVISNELIENRPEVVAEFLKRARESVEWVNANPAKAGEYVEALGLGLKAKIVEKSIPRSNLMFRDASESEEAIMKYFGILHGFSPELVGGKLPDEGFFLDK